LRYTFERDDPAMQSSSVSSLGSASCTGMGSGVLGTDSESSGWEAWTSVWRLALGSPRATCASALVMEGDVPSEGSAPVRAAPTGAFVIESSGSATPKVPPRNSARLSVNPCVAAGPECVSAKRAQLIASDSMHPCSRTLCRAGSGSGLRHIVEGCPGFPYSAQPYRYRLTGAPRTPVLAQNPPPQHPHANRSLPPGCLRMIFSVVCTPDTESPAAGLRSTKEGRRASLNRSINKNM
jgi:hypothetical protein